MKNIVLEILRDGPPQNQLLSPLTKYMVLCGEHAATSLQIPFEHAHWLARMGALAYRDSEETRQLQVADIAGVMARLLEQVPGLVAELTRSRMATPNHRVGARFGAGRVRTVHLRLVLNGHELALLPFELANAPAAFPAAGQPLCLQSEVPLCVTREVRRGARVMQADWTRRPRILFAFADPGAPVPYEQHLLALRRAIDPWVFSSQGRGGKEPEARERRDAVQKHLTVLPQATVAAIRAACSEGDYTHVHILAHGVAMRRGDDRRFGLALHDSVDRGRIDIVDGERLAAALRPHVHDRSQSLAAPLVVSLGSCDSGNVGTVIGAGASVAHELHVKGIPLVVASQFPLTVAASIHAVKILFEGLLWGEDPRCVVDDLRRQLKSLLPTSHDWASVVAYADLPSDIEVQCDRLAFEQARRSIDAGLDAADRAIAILERIGGEEAVLREWQASQRQMPPSHEAPGQAAGDQAAPERAAGEAQLPELGARWKRWWAMGGAGASVDDYFAAEFGKLEQAARKLRDLLNAGTTDPSWVHGRLAATHKRIAQLHVTAAGGMSGPRRRHEFSRARGHLEKSLEEYEAAFVASRDDAWALIQGLVLRAVLGGVDGRWGEQWLLARLLSESDLANPERSVWAHGNLIELHLLATIPDFKVAADRHVDLARSHTQRLVETATGEDEQEIFSTRRQLERYVRFFPALNKQMGAAAQLAEGLVEMFPKAKAHRL